MQSNSSKARDRDTKEIILIVLGRTYDVWGIQNQADFIASIVSVLEDPANRVRPTGSNSSQQPSIAAETIRLWLYSKYEENTRISSYAVANLFHALGREDELGRIPDVVEGYKFKNERFPALYDN